MIEAENAGRLAPAEMQMVEPERERLQIAHDTAKEQVAVFEAKWKVDPARWLWVQLYAEWWAELEIARRAIAKVEKRS